MNINRCSWVNLNNPKYVKYHDEEWCEVVHDDNKLFMNLIFEIFQAGLSYEIILNKKEYFIKAFDNFDIDKIINYDDNKINELLNNPYIIRNKSKIKAVINNAKVFKKIQMEFKSFDNFIWSFTNNKIIYETNKTKSDLSDKVTINLKQRGMKFIGSVTIYSYLQSIGIINSHENGCFKYKHNLVL